MLKLTAMVLMLIDHAALVFLPATSPLYTLCRLIGRLAMPIFAYKIAFGFIHTSNFKHYVKRVGFMTLCAQIPFIWMALGLNISELFASSTLSYYLLAWNVGLTFVCSLLILRLFEGLYNTTARYPALDIIYIVLLGLLSMLGDYNIYGVIMVIIFYVFIKYRHSYSLCFGLLLLATVGIYLSSLLEGNLYPLFMQLPCVLSILLIKYIPDSQLPFGRNLWYSFYPVHMLILALLGCLIA